MINSVQALTTIMNDSKCNHWRIFNTYNASNPIAIASSEALGPDPTMDQSLARLNQFFNMFGPGTYYVQYNDKNLWTKGFNASQVTHQVQPALQQQGNIGNVGVPEGYVSKAELQLMLADLKKENEIAGLKDQIKALKDGDGSKHWFEKLLDNPEISKAIGNLITKGGELISPPPAPVHRLPVNIGTVGFKDETNKVGNEESENAKSDNEQEEPEHIKNLNDDQWNAVALPMNEICLEMWALDPEFPALLPKLLNLIKTNPDVYNSTKGMLKMLP